MDEDDARRATAAAQGLAGSVGLAAGEAAVLQDSDKLTLRLLPCDTVARVAPADRQDAAFEVDLATQLAAAGSPVVVPDPRVGPRVLERDGFVVTLWTHHPSAAEAIPPADYAKALHALHAGMRTVGIASPRFTDRVADARATVADRGRSPALSEAERALLGGALDTLEREVLDRGAEEQLLHGEPHPGNLLATARGPLFIDLETACRGPVEFDLAHAPEEVAAHVPGVDGELLRLCRLLSLALITTWRWDREDRFPDGRRLGREWLAELAAGLRGSRT